MALPLRLEKFRGDKLILCLGWVAFGQICSCGLFTASLFVRVPFTLTLHFFFINAIAILMGIAVRETMEKKFSIWIIAVLTAIGSIGNYTVVYLVFYLINLPQIHEIAI
ncbi:MAG: hypothetical protein WC659_06875 [Patescibacteria group bacterium]